MGRFGWYRRRRGVLEHVQSGEINLLELGIHDYLCLRANDQVDGGSDSVPVGVCFESARSIHGHCGRTVSERTVQRALDHLAALGWIKRWMERGKHGNYPILIARYSVQDARGNEYRISALETDDWRHPRLDLAVSADCRPSVALVSVKDEQLQLVPSVASETSGIPVSVNCRPSVVTSSTYKGRDRDRDRDKKSSGAAHQPDPRHQAIKTAYFASTTRAGIANPDWNGADGKALNDLLKHHAGVGADTIVRWLENAFVSARESNGPLQPKFRFTEFCRHSMKYQTGPAGPPAWKSGSNGHRREDTPTQADLERMLAERGIPGSRPV